MTHSHLSLFDDMNDATLLDIEEAVRRYVDGLGGEWVELTNFANRCRNELQHRQVERLRADDDGMATPEDLV